MATHNDKLRQGYFHPKRLLAFLLAVLLCVAMTLLGLVFKEAGMRGEVLREIERVRARIAAKQTEDETNLDKPKAQTIATTSFLPSTLMRTPSGLPTFSEYQKEIGEEQNLLRRLNIGIHEIRRSIPRGRFAYVRDARSYSPSYFTFKRYTEWTPKNEKSIRETLAKYKDMLEVLRSDLTSDNIALLFPYDLMGARGVCKAGALLAFQTLLAARNGQLDEALELFGALLDLGAKLDDTGFSLGVAESSTSIMFLAAVTLQQMLSEITIPEGSILTFNRKLGRLDSRKDFVRNMEDTPLHHLQWMEKTLTKNCIESKSISEKASRLNFILTYRATIRSNDELAYLRRYEHAMKLIRRPYYEGNRGLTELNKEFSKPWVSFLPESRFNNVCFVCSSCGFEEIQRLNIYQTMRDTLAAQMSIALSLNLHKAKHGVYPKTLDALASPVPTDPFSGKPMTYERVNNGYVLSSTGPDQGWNNSMRYRDDIIWRVDQERELTDIFGYRTLFF